MASSSSSSDSPENIHVPSGLHSNAIFALVPINERAREIVRSSDNRHLFTVIDGNIEALQIGHVHPLSNEAEVLATLGRVGDVRLGNGTTRDQCRFIFDVESKEVSVKEESADHSTSLRGAQNAASRFKKLGKSVINCTTNIHILLGHDTFLAGFSLRWCGDDTKVIRRLEKREFESLIEHPDSIATRTAQVPVERHTDRLLTPSATQEEPHYIRENAIGRGGSGIVYKAKMIGSNQLMAVKVVRRPEDKLGLAQLKFEIETHQSLEHPNIIRCFGSSGYAEKKPEVSLFLDYAPEGDLVNLFGSIKGNNYVQDADAALKQLLAAFRYLHGTKSLAHRDVKPKNILVKRQQGPLQTDLFLLTDFGLVSPIRPTTSGVVGHPAFTAPEVQNGERHALEGDMWSLLATVLWMVDFHEFRRLSAKQAIKDIWDLMAKAASQRAFFPVQKMAEINPANRLSARKALQNINESKWCLEGQYFLDNPPPSPMKGIEYHP